MDTAVAGLIGAVLAGGVTLVGTIFGGRRVEIRSLWSENRARGEDLRLERVDRQAAEARWAETVQQLRTEMAANEERCQRQLEEQEARCQEQLGVLEGRIAGLGGA
jgi:hypothetical protein